MSFNLDSARTLALEAGERLMQLRGTELRQERKPDHSLVTNADHEADQILREGLSRAFPDHAIITEESQPKGALDSEFVWLVDPLDGTRAFAKGRPGFSVMVGLLRRGEPYAGIVFDPLAGQLFEAVRGEGSWRIERGERRAARVTDRREWPEMPVITSTGFPEPLARQLTPVFPGPWLPAVNSVGVKVGYMVRGLADIYVNHHRVHYWDTCAPQVILEEAGGTITYWDGTPLTYDLHGRFAHSRPTLATNRVRHAQALAALGSITPPDA